MFQFTAAGNDTSSRSYQLVGSIVDQIWVFGGEVDQSRRPRPKLNPAGPERWPSHLQGAFTSDTPFCVYLFVDGCQLRRGWTPSRRQRTELDSLCCCFLGTSSSGSVWFGLRPELLLSKTTIPASVRTLITVHSSYRRLCLWSVKGKSCFYWLWGTEGQKGHICEPRRASAPSIFSFFPHWCSCGYI